MNKIFNIYLVLYYHVHQNFEHIQLLNETAQNTNCNK